MAKAKTVFVCANCGFETPKWLGRCPDCDQWNTFTEEVKQAPVEVKMVKSKGISAKNKPKILGEIESSKRQRFDTGIPELNRVLGGGLVRGSLTLISGDPGIGKSTLLLQAAGAIARGYGTVLYVSGEESEEQIKMRAERCGVNSKNLFIVSETNIAAVDEHIQSLKPVFAIVDSIQTLFSQGITSAPGSVSQVRECASELMRLGKTNNLPLFIVAHVTKQGELAGPRVLEHMVDTVLHFEGERSEEVRILRTVKNRFGTTSEIGLFEMKETGLSQVTDPSRLFLEEGTEEGTMVVGSLEGSRTILAQIQTLVVDSHIAVPRRTAVGIGVPRLLMILAVLEKKLNIPFYAGDVYVNVVGGLTLDGPASDLGLALALISSARGKEILGEATMALGEVGLTGEIRPIARGEKILSDAAKLGFTTAIVSSRQTISHPPKGLTILSVSNLSEASQKVFENQRKGRGRAKVSKP